MKSLSKSSFKFWYYHPNENVWILRISEFFSDITNSSFTCSLFLPSKCFSFIFFLHRKKQIYLQYMIYIWEISFCVFIFLQNFNLNFNNILTAKENNVIPIIRNHFEIAWLIQSKAKYWSKIYASKILHYQKSDFCYIHEKD